MSCAGMPTNDWGLLPTHTHEDEGCQGYPTDPVNIIFDGIRIDAIIQLLTRTVNSHIGQPWTRPSLLFFATAHDHWVTTTRGCVRQDAQLVAGPLTERMHIRLWAFSPGIVVAGAHKEFGLTLGLNATPYFHRPSSFETGKDSVCDDFQNDPSGYQTDRRAIFLDNYRIDPYSSGFAAYISR